MSESATIGLPNPARFGWGFRGVAAGIFAAALAYFGSGLLACQGGKPMGVFGPRSVPSLWNAGLFLLVFGLPALSYLLSGSGGSSVDAIASEDLVDPDEGASSRPFESSDRSRRPLKQPPDLPTLPTPPTRPRPYAET